MSTEEFEIIAFLKQAPDAFFSRKEIARKARRRDEYEENPHWAAAPLASLEMQGHVEKNMAGLYKLAENFRG